MAGMTARLDRIERDQHQRIVERFRDGWHLTVDQAERVATAHEQAMPRASRGDADGYARRITPVLNDVLGRDVSDIVQRIAREVVDEFAQ